MRLLAKLAALLIVTQGMSVAATWPPQTPLTSQSLAAWLKKICSAATCQQVKAQSLVHTHTTQVFPESKAYVITKAGQKFYLLNDFAPKSGQLPLQELTFMPYRVSDKWTPTRLNMVAGWLTSLAGGNLNADAMWQCVTRLKQQNSFGMPLDPSGQGKLLNSLALSQEETAIGSCYWLEGKRNVGFGFAGKGKY